MIEIAPSPGEGAAIAPSVVVTASLDNLQSPDVRFLQEASRIGTVHVRLMSDALVESGTGRSPRFSQAERVFLARSLRYVGSAAIARSTGGSTGASSRPTADAMSWQCVHVSNARITSADVSE